METTQVCAAFWSTVRVKSIHFYVFQMLRFPSIVGYKTLFGVELLLSNKEKKKH